METIRFALTILAIGMIGGIVYTAATHPAAIQAAGDAGDKLYKTGIAGTLGQVA